jgi:putative ABC transport system permease protein
VFKLSQILRRIKQKPALAGFSIASLAIGLAATTAIYSIVDAVILKPLPFPDSENLVRVYETAPDGHMMAFAAGNADDLNTRQTLFTGLARFQQYAASVSGDALDGAAKRIIPAQIYQVDANYFSVLALQPFQGRNFGVQSDANQAIVNESAWQQLFPGRSFGAADAHLSAGDNSGNVIGIIQQSASLVPGPAVYFPLPAGDQTARSAHNYGLIGRLKPGVTVLAAQAQSNAIAEQIKSEHGDKVDLAGITAVPWLDDILGSGASALWLIMAASMLLLLIGCANVANLFLSDLLLRRREFAVQAALGATPAVLRRAPVTELIVLTAISALIAWPLAKITITGLTGLLANTLPRADQITLSLKTWGILVAASAVCMGLVALAISLWLARAKLEQYSTAQERSQSLSKLQLWIQKAFLALQTAFMVTLLLGATAIGRSVDQLLAQSLGFSSETAIGAELTLPDRITAAPDFSGVMTAARLQAPVELANAEYSRYLNALRAVPGVQSAGLINALPLSGSGANGTFLIESLSNSAEPPYNFQGLSERFDSWPKENMGDAEFRLADAGYFASMGIGLKRGRLFAASDTASAPQTALISETVAKRSFSGRDPIGARIQFGNMDGDLRLLTVVGVVADVRELDLAKAMPGTIYANLAQRRPNESSLTLVVRTAKNLDAAAIAALMQAMRSALAQVAPGQPVTIAPLQANVRAALGVRHASSTLFFAFAAAAVLLAGLGLFALTGFVISQQTRSLSVRAALGASPRQILRGVYLDWVLVQAAGLALGLAAAALLLNGLKTQLFNVSLFQPSSMLIVVIGVLLITAVAAALPARRAAKADAGVLLR